jgi:hypothetical protein
MLNKKYMRERSIFDGDLPGIHNPLLGSRPEPYKRTRKEPELTEEDMGVFEGLTPDEIEAREAFTITEFDEPQAAPEHPDLIAGLVAGSIQAQLDEAIIIAHTEEDFGADEPSNTEEVEFPEDGDII